MRFLFVVLALFLALPVVAQSQSFSEDLPASVPDPSGWPDPWSLHMKGTSGETAGPADKAVVTWLIHEGLCDTDQDGCDFFIRYEVFVNRAPDGSALEHEHRYIVLAKGRILEGLAYSYKDDHQLHDMWIRRSGGWEERTDEAALRVDAQLVAELDKIVEKAKRRRQQDFPGFLSPGSALIANGGPHGTPFICYYYSCYDEN